MKELINRLVSQADLTEEQAEKAASVVKGFLTEKLPEALRGPVDSALSGQNVDNAFDQAKNLIGGFLK
jgi:3-dehydroquinate synthetase